MSLARLFALLALLCFAAVLLKLHLGSVNLVALGWVFIAACLAALAPAGWEWQQRRP